MPGLIEKSGATSGRRKVLFYGVCVPLRLLLALFVYWKSTNPSVQGLVLTASAVSVYINLLSLNSSDRVWWSREFHALTSLTSLFLLLRGFPGWVPGVMVLDVLFGLVTSFARDPSGFK